MNELYELKEKLCDELRSYGKKDLSAGSLDVVDKLTHTVKNLNRIISESEGYSHDYYDGMRSYRRGRDSMGRYTSRDGYSYHGDMVIELRELMNEAPDEKTKQEFKRFISKIESM